MIEEKELKEAFEKLSYAQKINALKFGSLSDFHMCKLRQLLDSHTQSAPEEIRPYLYELYMCSEYTGTPPYGGGNHNEQEYRQWCRDRIFKNY